MADNLYFTFKQGEGGKVLVFTLKDESGLFPLTGWVVTLACKLNGASVFTAQACVNDPDQVLNKGVTRHTLNATTAAIAPNTGGQTYTAELKATSGSNVFYWPVDKDNRRTYFKMEVQSPLS
jgi:hypothetical protein